MRAPSSWRTTARLALVVLALALVTQALAPQAVAGGAAARQAAVDRTLDRGECDLLGRTYDARQGCRRDSCVRGAVPDLLAPGAEVCRLSGQRGQPYATAVPFDMCRALHRKWIAEVNWCASNPYRDRTVVFSAPQCQAPFTVYITHTERPGRYDECVAPSRFEELTGLAAAVGRPVELEAALRSAVLCADLPHQVLVNGLCVDGITPNAARGGTLLVGDSIAWRGRDELTPAVRGLTVDGIPGRKFTDLPGRLDRYRAFHGNPTGLIVALGANEAPGFGKAGLNQTIATVPHSTRVLLVLPFRHLAQTQGRAPYTGRYAAWMRNLAKHRARTCVADWPALVRRHPEVLADGVHPTHESEVLWAAWIATQWRACRRSHS